MAVASASESANPPRPEPSTRAILGRNLVRARMYCAAASAFSYSPAGFMAGVVIGTSSFVQNTHDGRRHQVGHGAGQHGAEAQPGQLSALVRRQGANAADLYADGAEVGEAAQGKRSDGEAAHVQRALQWPELPKGDQLIQGHAQAQQIADGGGVMPGNADQPGDRRKY